MLFISPRTTIAILLLTFFHISKATLSLPSLQPISGFTDQCIQAYQSPIEACPAASSFVNPSQPPCTRDCALALVNAASSIQQACARQTANRGTIIGQAFQGNLALFLCNGENIGDGNAASTLTASNAMPSTASTNTVSSSSTTTSTSRTTSTTESSSSSSKTTVSTSTTTSVISTSSTTKSSPTSSISSTPRSITSLLATKSSGTPSSSIKPSSSTSAKASTTSIDSTPFDQTVSAASNLVSWPGIGKYLTPYSLISLSLLLFGI